MDAADDRRRLDPVEQALDDRADARLCRPRAPRRDRAGGTGQIEEVRALGLVELEGPRPALRARARRRR